MLVVIAFVILTIIFSRLPLAALDWRNTFYQVSQNPFYPYNIKTFINLPWTVFILFPFHYFSEKTSLAMNASLSFILIGILIHKRKGGILSMFITFTSFPFIALIINGGIEWIPVLGLILQNSLGLILLLTKPQSGILAIISWLPKIRNKALFFLPMILVTIFRSSFGETGWKK
jgi:hypothetical protein